ncbi:MAG TPA: hypothetical protein VGQ12_02980, partial [Candidatus Angelobacter sp.]|nr:hypothetical protein [Candidatus Angelobacter sp.]
EHHYAEVAEIKSSPDFEMETDDTEGSQSTPGVDHGIAGVPRLRLMRCSDNGEWRGHFDWPTFYQAVLAIRLECFFAHLSKSFSEFLFFL